MAGNYIFYCDYDPGPGFGNFFGKACTNPALYTETVFPARPVIP